MINAVLSAYYAIKRSCVCGSLNRYCVNVIPQSRIDNCLLNPK